MGVIATVPVLPGAAVNFLKSQNSFHSGDYAARAGFRAKLVDTR
jgi:hypothetical protein